VKFLIKTADEVKLKQSYERGKKKLALNVRNKLLTITKIEQAIGHFFELLVQLCLM
jgi:hypothetical protein